jgi:hypothetical protein
MLRALGLSFLAWSVIWLFDLSQMWLNARVNHEAMDLHRLTRLSADVFSWALYSPLVVRLGERLPLEGRTWKTRLPLHLAIGLGFAGLDAAIANAIAPFAGPFPNPGFVVLYARISPISVFGYFGVLAIGHALRYRHLFRDRQIHASELERQLAETRLGVLEAQLRPHFLFNALHTVGSLVRSGDREGAVRTLTALGDLLRAGLREGSQEVTLREELALVGRYFEIELARFGDRLSAAVDADPRSLEALVPRFLLQPLVENAVRHGIEQSAHPGRVEVHAERHGDALRLEVRDTGGGPGAAPSPRKGLGLANTRARLHHLYGDRQRLELGPAEGGGTVARVEIPFHASRLEVTP